MGKIIVVYCLDNNYITLAEKSIKTVKKFNPDAKIVVVSENKMNVEGADEYYVHKINRVCRHKEGADRITDAAYLKLELPELLPYDKVIFIDGDIECKSSLKPLWDIDCPYVCWCESHSYGKEQAKDLGLIKYALTSVMVMNLKTLREFKLAEKCLEVEKTLPTPQTGWCHEETEMNIVLKGLTTFLDKKWCYCLKRNYDTPIRWEYIKLLHYIGGKNKQDMLALSLYKNMKPIMEDIKGKRVAIVGNAKSIFDKKDGDKIDGHDFVIRFNKGFITNPESQGTKTNLLILACDLTEEEIKSYNSKWVINRSEYYNNQNVFGNVSSRDREQLTKIIEYQPSSGLIAIDMCLTALAKSITLFGFDFEKTPTFYNPEGYITKHCYSNEEKYVMNLEKYGLVERK